MHMKQIKTLIFSYVGFCFYIAFIVLVSPFTAHFLCTTPKGEEADYENTVSQVFCFGFRCFDLFIYLFI